MADPSPVYADENITVYGIPLAPETSCSFHSGAIVDVSAKGALHESSKRKRSPSPESSSKRGRDSGALDSHRKEDVPLTTRMFQPHFNPSDLQGEDAQEWRRRSILNMFRVTEPPPINPKRGHRRVPDKLTPESASQLVPVAPDTEAREGPNRPKHPYRHLRLPKFERLPEYSNNPLCYVCVGPRQRGKFDAKRAQELGVPRGPLRGKLTKGETITFAVDDASGGKVERTVRPEDCVGPSEAPKVIFTFEGQCV